MTRTLQLRSYQQTTCDDIDEAIARGIRRILVTMPTGAGKTVVLVKKAHEAWLRGERVLIASHRREIIDQILQHLMLMGVPRGAIGLMHANTLANPSAPIQLASIMTLIRRDLPEADLVIIDEAHRARAKSYAGLFRHYRNAVHLGFTATPIRFDGKGLGKVYQELLAPVNYSDLHKVGALTPCEVYSVPDKDLPMLHGVRVLSGGDYDLTQLEAAVNKTRLLGIIVKQWKKHALGRQTVCFAVNINHARSIVERFRKARVKAEILTGSTPTAERDLILTRFKAGKITVLVNCMVLGEGWDMPECKCVILARPTRSLVVYNQQAGRILRPHEGITPIVLDHAGNVLRFEHPDKDRDWSLAGRKKRPRPPPMRLCPKCDLMSSAGCRACPKCGYEFPVVPIEGEADVELTLIEREKEIARIEAHVRKEAASIPGADEAFVQAVLALRTKELA